MAGTTTNPIFKQDGQYLSFTVSDAAIPLGSVVMLYTDGTARLATQTSLAVVGVAVSGNRIARTATDDQVAIGSIVTVCTRGVVNCITTTTATIGGYVEVAATAGAAVSAAASAGATFGKCIAAPSATVATVLLRGY